jgi:hypothetical protein
VIFDDGVKMAKYIGGLNEFNKYFGPYIRNTINGICRNERNARNSVCEHCGEKSELQSAHIEGKARVDIIRSVFESFPEIENIGIDIDLIMSEIVNRHYPIKDTFLFLCESCHRIYDKRTATTKSSSFPKSKIDKQEENTDIINNEIQKVVRKVPKWFRNPSQINSIILISFFKLYSNDFVELKSLEASVNLGSRFFSNLTQMSIISEKNHAKVFSLQNEEVRLWEPVKKTVIDMYNEYVGKNF